jgi:hypothetical protein
LLATLLFLAATVLFVAAPAWWWAPAAPALVISEVLIVTSWDDAKFGTVANVIVLVPLVIALLDFAPWSFRSIYRREVAAGLQGHTTNSALLTDADLAHLPRVVQAYLRYAGAVGKPRVHDFRVRFRGTFRRGADAPWMPTTVEQYSFYDPPSRVFLMGSTLYGVPFEALHIYAGSAATMRVRVASVVPVVDAQGPQMNQSETVTLFNDMCLLAPATLADAEVVWEELDARSAKATFSNAGQTISAVLSFDEAGALTNFVSDDRYQSLDGTSYKNRRWSTPVQAYRDVGGRRVMAVGEARWTEPEGEFSYARLELSDIEYNLR